MIILTKNVHKNCLTYKEKGNENDNKCTSCSKEFNLLNNNCIFKLDEFNIDNFIKFKGSKEELINLISLYLDYFLKMNKTIKGKDYSIELLKSNDNNELIDIDLIHV